MLRSSLVSAVCILSLVGFSFLAEVAGRWEGTLYAPDGTDYPLLYTFQVDGEALTGTLASDGSEIPIRDGSVHGDSVSFVIDTDAGTFRNLGRVAGDSIYMVLLTGQEDLDYVLTRAAPQ